MYKRTVLSNGLRILTASMPHTRAVSIEIIIGVGSRFEAREQSGLSHFIEHMVFKGSQQRPSPLAISEAIESVGGVINAATGQEATSYWVKVARPYMDHALNVLVDMIRHPLFTPAEIEKERMVILEEIKSTYDHPSDLVNLMIGEVLWGDHPLGRDVAGTQDTVMSFTREHALAYMERHYGAANTVVAVAGAVDHEDVVFRVEALLGDWPAGQRSEAIPAQDGQVAPRYRVTYKKTEQVHLCLAVPGLRHDHPDRYAQSLLNAILGEGMSSRLFTEIRERRGLAYDVHAYINRYRDAGEEVVYAAVAPEKATDAVQAVLEQLARLRDEPVPEVELAKTKEFVKGRILLSTEDSRNMASWLGNADMFMGEILDVDEVLRRIDAVTPEDIQRVARASYQQAKLNMAIVGPVKKAHSLGSLLSL